MNRQDFLNAIPLHLVDAGIAGRTLEKVVVGGNFVLSEVLRNAASLVAINGRYTLDRNGSPCISYGAFTERGDNLYCLLPDRLRFSTDGVLVNVTHQVLDPHSGSQDPAYYRSVALSLPYDLKYSSVKFGQVVAGIGLRIIIIWMFLDVGF